jgi:actin, other eukaryote
VNSIQRCDIDIRAELYGNILLSGGSTMFPGLAKRLKKELKDIAPLGTKIKIESAVAERNFAAWIGGSMLLRNALSAASSTQSSDIMISKKEYEEKGTHFGRQLGPEFLLTSAADL